MVLLYFIREKWVSILSHIVNKHKWSGSVKYKKCGHGRLTQNEERIVGWLKAGKPAHKALQDVVENKLLLKATSHLTKFCHTGELEVFHSMLLKYCSKRQHFPYEGNHDLLFQQVYSRPWQQQRQGSYLEESAELIYQPSPYNVWVI